MQVRRPGAASGGEQCRHGEDVAIEKHAALALVVIDIRVPFRRCLDLGPNVSAAGGQGGRVAVRRAAAYHGNGTSLTSNVPV